MKWMLIALLLLPSVAAVQEADAPSQDERIKAVWHMPERPEPNTQWQGFIQFEPGHNVTDVRYQICRVGQFCFAGPTLAEFVGQDTWKFDTNNYGIRGQTVEWGINDAPGDDSNWLVGVQFFLLTADDNRTDPFAGAKVPAGEMDCLAVPADQFLACEETHYITFEMDGRSRADQKAPGLPLLLVVTILAALTWRRR